MIFPFAFTWNFENETVAVHVLTEPLSLDMFEMLGQAILEAVKGFRADVARGGPEPYDGEIIELPEDF